LTAKKLLRAFGSASAVRAAGRDALAEVAGEKVADKVRAWAAGSPA